MCVYVIAGTEKQRTNNLTTQRQSTVGCNIVAVIMLPVQHQNFIALLDGSGCSQSIRDQAPLLMSIHNRLLDLVKTDSRMQILAIKVRR